MHKRILLLFSAVSLSLLSFAQLKSPEAFLGYKIGTRYTPHWRVVSYYQYVAQTLPANVKLVQYGETNEHRPLYTAFISSAENISNLENIRTNNLRLANLAKDKAMPSENAPAIVWLSYNVHGNETSSSEAGLLTIFALADPNNAQSKEWLKNTVVIMDPCVNPDGRDRYVNWFNSIVGMQYNPRLDSREHREPWPGGRSNHYNFDLNRDWAWQTQIESQQRIKVYNQWMPQVHVDFHEQSINSPYYFAPAAQPYHEAITKWQRDFQVTIGKNHAKYFDKNNWLYFTKEVFDLFYPSYGDTYPIYNGAIGMTYEQGGGGSSGLGADTDEGDTLTLYDRAMHHFTTSLSTVEISSLNATNLLKEYRKFFNDAVAAANSEYKSYVIKNKPEDKERISALLTLLDKNAIQYTTGSGAGRGYSYHTGKEESFSVGQGDIVISAAQPRSTMVRLLFEPQSRLVDSATYDITAWSMPYAYGLTAFASKAAISGGGAVSKDSVKNSSADSYGYVIPWLGVSSARAVGQLMSAGIKVRFSESPFEVSGKSFARGAVIVLKKGNEKFGSTLWTEVAKICDQNNVTMSAVSTGFVDKGYDFGSGKVHPMKAVKVAMLTGDGVSSLGAGEVWHFFEKELRYPITLINAADIARAKWSDIDVLIMPEGNYRFLSDKGSAEQFVLWVRNGGRVVAMESAAGQLSRQDWSVIAAKKDDKDKDTSGRKDPYAALKLFNDRDRDGIENTTPGSIFRVDVDSSHPLMYGYPNYYYTLKMDDVLYEFTKDGAGWNAGVLKKDNQLAGFVGYKLKKKLKDGLLFATQDLGRGSVTYLTDDVLFRNFWENGKLMFCNAVFMVGQ
ncbi:MAG: zinc carboxypeptidase [Chitinophagaceae bacterium]|nr:zinc carboxypeptidase [Chitinophagaceae bacterium]